MFTLSFFLIGALIESFNLLFSRNFFVVGVFTTLHFRLWYNIGKSIHFCYKHRCWFWVGSLEEIMLKLLLKSLPSQICLHSYHTRMRELWGLGLVCVGSASLCLRLVLVLCKTHIVHFIIIIVIIAKNNLIYVKYFDSVSNFWSSCFQTKHPISLVFFFFACFRWYEQIFYMLESGTWTSTEMLSFSGVSPCFCKQRSEQHFRWDIGPLPSPVIEYLSLLFWRALSFPTRLQPTGNQVNLCNPTLTFSEKMSPSTQLIYFNMFWSCS